MTICLRAMFAFAVLLFAACAPARHALQIQAHDNVFNGYMNVGPNAQDVHVEGANGEVSCEGISLVGYAGLGCPSNGSLRLACSDGREITGDWRMPDCENGTGSGVDDRGNSVTFVIGSESGTATPANTAPPARATGTEAPAGDGQYAFRFGGEYAAGFADSRTYPWQILFEDPAAGLVIFRVTAEPLAMVLADELPQDGQQAFVVLPGPRVIAIYLEAASATEWRVRGLSEPAGGLPVMDADGRMIGLTMLSDDGTQLMPARRLRRYVRTFDPALAEQPAVPATATGHSTRIMTSHRD